jgi:hypothetical protein
LVVVVLRSVVMLRLLVEMVPASLATTVVLDFIIDDV